VVDDPPPRSHAGAIIEQIQPKFDIVAAEAVRLSPDRAEQFHAVYKGVVAPALFAAMVQELASGEACKPLWGWFSLHTWGALAQAAMMWLLLPQMHHSIRCGRVHQWQLSADILAILCLYVARSMCLGRVAIRSFANCSTFLQAQRLFWR
jgi:hypothetical protein